MNEIEVRILKLDGISGYPDVLCSVYSNETLLDAFTLEDQMLEPILFCASGNLKQIILITVKCISLNVFIGFAKFRLDDLIDSEFILTLPLALPEHFSDSQEIPTISLQLVNKKLGKVQKRSKSLEIQSIEQKRFEWSRWEGQVVQNLKKLIKAKTEFEIKKKQIKEFNEKFPLDYENYKKFLKHCQSLNSYKANETKCQEFVRSNEELEVELFNNRVIISNLRAQKKKMKVEINFYRKLLGFDGFMKNDEELTYEISLKENDLKITEQEIADLDSLIKENMRDAVNLSQENCYLRETISILEKKT